MAQYATEQKKMLVDFLREHHESSFSVDQIVLEMKKNDAQKVPATSTVYRLITKLVEEGTVKRFVRGHSRQFLYQIVDRDHCRSHLHLRCMDCGKLIHLNEKLSDELLDVIRSTSDFSVNEEETVLVGACSDCSRIKKEG
jgi:Fur family ferric uptake transcriptional regulator